MQLHWTPRLVWSQWHLLHAFQFACNVNSAIMFFMQSLRGAVIGKLCSYLACQLKGLKFLACCVLPDNKFYGNCFYWCKYVRDFDDAMSLNSKYQSDRTAKAIVPDRTVWLPKPACVIAAGRLSKALKDAHSKGAKQCARPCCPLLKLLLIKKSIILIPCASTQRKLENERRKSYRLLIPSCWTTDIRLFDF